MTIFLFDYMNNEITLNEFEIVLVREFGELMKVERNKCDEDPHGTRRLRAFREFTYIFLMLDWQSPYAAYSEYEKHQAALGDSGLTDEEWDDVFFKSACRKYKEIQESALDIKLIKAAKSKVFQLIDYFDEGSDLTERDPLTGKPIFKAKDVMAEMSSVSKVLDELDVLEERIKKKKKAASRLQAGAEEGFIPKL